MTWRTTVTILLVLLALFTLVGTAGAAPNIPPRPYVTTTPTDPIEDNVISAKETIYVVYPCTNGPPSSWIFRIYDENSNLVTSPGTGAYYWDHSPAGKKMMKFFPHGGMYDVASTRYTGADLPKGNYTIYEVITYYDEDTGNPISSYTYGPDTFKVVP